MDNGRLNGTSPEEEARIAEETALADEAFDKDLASCEEEKYYQIVPEEGNLVWSLLSLVFAVLSVVMFSFFYIGGIISAVAAIALAVVSSRKLGYFDRMGLFGLIFGIFGLVFGIFSMVVDLTGVLDGLSF
ncbi:MAG: hypothetical protein IKC32_02075 [Clostridia bacterium]|nr:hypothetical protein [Clostridia bacterium]